MEPVAKEESRGIRAAVPLRIGVSACLMGREVRFDGQHKRDAFLVDELGPFVEFVPVCPEVEVGMSIPRETVRLVRLGERGRSGTPSRLVASRSGEDWTARMNAYAEKRVERLARENLSGFVLKKDSPSCGLLRVKRYDDPTTEAKAERDGTGLFAGWLQRTFPQLPIEEEGRLYDAKLRENFIERIFAYHRLRALWATRWTLRSLIAFHTAHKMALLAHDEPGYRRLGRLVALGKSLPRDELRQRYEAGFMETLTKLATPGRHANVMTHMFGHFSDKLDRATRDEILTVIEDHQKELIPLVVPLTLLRHYVRLLKVTYLADQTYLEPHPKELMLRNRV
ncbi:MAG TPA: DUF523 and DUF1722 domain-containing protein [Polyangia bacterium]|jgi:uncharacterized protein YbgA (DUF1722 family)/uncharacterized protein YbbK (DUF523 family)